MRLLLLFSLTFTLLLARENPFEPVFNIPKVEENSIPLLDIKTHQAFKSPTELIQVKKEQISLPLVAAPISQPQVKDSSEKNSSTTIVKQQKIASKETSRTKKVTKHQKKIKKRVYKTLYQNYFLKVRSNGKYFKIYTCDRLLKKTMLAHPKRVALDFQRLQYFRTKNLSLSSKYAKKIKFGSHHEFYRITLELTKKTKYKLTKRPYGYLLTLY